MRKRLVIAVLFVFLCAGLLFNYISSRVGVKSPAAPNKTARAGQSSFNDNRTYTKYTKESDIKDSKIKAEFKISTKIHIIVRELIDTAFEFESAKKWEATMQSAKPADNLDDLEPDDEISEIMTSKDWQEELEETKSETVSALKEIADKKLINEIIEYEASQLDSEYIKCILKGISNEIR